ncbi:MAG: DUF3488 domain-containing protein, partial [Oligoflexia bacterium]|nr:DUF3488 domain-containing protein [Oligoflexia bacterium]
MSRLSTWKQLGGAGVLGRTERARRWVTLVVALVGCAVGALGEGTLLVVSLAAALGILVGRWLRQRRGLPSPRAQDRWRGLNTSALILCVLAAFAQTPLLVLGMGLVAWLQVHRAWTGRGARDDRVALLLALLQALMGCVVTASVLLAPLFLMLILLVPIGLALCHLGLESEGARARRQRPGGSAYAPRGLLLGLAPISAVLTVFFFLILPRIDGGASLAGDSPDRVTGFGKDVDIGDLGELLKSEQVVLRLRITDADGQPFKGPVYLRGAALDSFDGQRWRSTLGRGGTWTPPPLDAPGLLRQEVFLEPISETVIFGLGEIVQVRGTGRGLVRDGNGTVRYRGAPDRLHYTAWSLPARPGAAPRPTAIDAWTQLPADLDPRIVALADRVLAQAGGTAGHSASPWQKAVTLTAFLRHDYRYSLVPPELPGGVAPADPLAWFLFQSRAGHCEYFATALAVMLRTQGIPARVVNGFLGGELNPLDGWLLVRQRDAHSWVEVNLGAQGWVTLDATPAGDQPPRIASAWSQAQGWLTRRWDSAVIDYDLPTQLGALAAVGRVLQPPGVQADSPLELPEIGGVVVLGLAGAVAVLSLRLLLGWL